MSRFRADFAAVAEPDLLDQFGETVVYQPPDGDAVTLTGVVQGKGYAEEESGGNRRIRHFAGVLVSMDPDNDGGFGGVASPVVGASVSIDSVAFRVAGVKRVGSLWKMTPERKPLAERARRGYRG